MFVFMIENWHYDVWNNAGQGRRGDQMETSYHNYVGHCNDMERYKPTLSLAII